MANYVHNDTMVIGVTETGERVNRKITDLEIGSQIIGFDLYNDTECINTVIDIIKGPIPVDKQIRLWYNSMNQDCFIVIEEEQYLDYFNPVTNTWEYKKAIDFKCTDIVKSFKELTKIGHCDQNCNMHEDDFIALVVDNSHNYYARKSESSKQQEELQNKTREKMKENPDAKEQELITEPVVYDQFYADCILLRADK